MYVVGNVIVTSRERKAPSLEKGTRPSSPVELGVELLLEGVFPGCAGHEPLNKRILLDRMIYSNTLASPRLPDPSKYVNGGQETSSATTISAQKLAQGCTQRTSQTSTDGFESVKVCESGPRVRGRRKVREKVHTPKLPSLPAQSPHDYY